MNKLIRKFSAFARPQWMQLAEVASFRAPALARTLGVSQRQLERYIQREFSRSPQSWLRELRMEKARDLIASMDSVKEIAYSLGFKQVSHFCREFKIHHGVTCSEFVLLPPAHEILAEDAVPGSEVRAEVSAAWNAIASVKDGREVPPVPLPQRARI